MYAHGLHHRVLHNLLYGQDVPPEDRVSEVVPDLDEIPKNIVGRANVSVLLTFAERSQLSILISVLLLIAPGAEVPAWAHAAKMTPADSQRAPTVDPRFAGHFADLVACGLLKAQEPRRSWFYSTYFYVLKTVDKARSIFNGKRLSKRCPVPDPVNLADTCSLVGKIFRFMSEQKGPRRCFVLGGDLRHWFHQIPAPDWMQRLFGLRARQAAGGFKDFVWTSIPMGWSWSPLIAQGVAWTFLMFREETDSRVFFEEAAFTGATGLPTFVNVIDPVTKEIKGFATVYYDNYLIMCWDSDLLDAIEQRLKANEKALRIVVKDGSRFSLNTAKFCNEGFDYLGVHFQGTKKKSRETPRAGTLYGMKWAPAKASSWEQQDHVTRRHLDCPGETVTLRAAARLVGQCVFSLLMAPGGLRRQEKADAVLLAARRIGLAAFHSKNWNSPLASEEPWVTDLGLAWSDAVSRTYERAFDDAENSMKAPEYLHILCTDASTTDGLGWCAFEADGDNFSEKDVEHLCGGRDQTRSERAAETDIFILEMKAALEGLAVWCAANPGTSEVTLVVDNSGAAFALRNGFSNNGEALLMMRSPTNLENLRRVEDVILVISEDNPADCCSRTRDVSRTEHARTHTDLGIRVRRMALCVAARRRGWCWASQKRTAFTREEGKGGIRHDGEHASGREDESACFVEGVAIQDYKNDVVTPFPSVAADLS